MRNLYEILGIERSATIKAIRSAFRNLAKRYHPDVAGESSVQAWQQLLIAHEVLTDENRRKHYDETGEYQDKPRNHTEQVALAIFSQLVTKLIAQPAELTRLDLKKYGLQHLNDEIDNLNGQLDGVRAAYERAKKISGRWAVNDPDQSNVLDSIVTAQFAELDRARQNILGQIEAYELAITILNRHDFRYDAKEQVVRYNTVFYNHVLSE